MKQIPPQEVQVFFREVMERWGRPKALRVDNGYPWGSGHDVPPPLALWLIGLGVVVVWIPPSTPQYNGVVERAQGVLQQWAEPEKWKSVEEGQERLAWAVKMQREGYRGEDGKTRIERYPQLEENPRFYSSAWEEAHWCIEEVDKWLARGSWVRKVGKTGQIYLYNRAYSVGRAYAKQEVFIRWNAQTRTWRVSNDQGEEIKVIQPKAFDKEAIRALSVTYIKPSRRRGHNSDAA